MKKVLPAAVIAVVASVLANLLARALLGLMIPIDAAFPPLQYGAIAIFTVLGVAAAGLVYALVVKFAPKPVPTYWIIAAVALVLSILPNLGFMANPASAPFPGGTAQGFGLLIVFHIVAAIVAVLALTRFSRA